MCEAQEFNAADVNNYKSLRLMCNYFESTEVIDWQRKSTNICVICAYEFMILEIAHLGLSLEL